jgi:hypothetical protein
MIEREPIFACFIDFQKAFDLVNRNLAFRQKWELMEDSMMQLKPCVDAQLPLYR